MVSFKSFFQLKNIILTLCAVTLTNTAVSAAPAVVASGLSARGGTNIGDVDGLTPTDLAGLASFLGVTVAELTPFLEGLSMDDASPMRRDDLDDLLSELFALGFTPEEVADLFGDIFADGQSTQGANERRAATDVPGLTMGGNKLMGPLSGLLRKVNLGKVIPKLAKLKGVGEVMKFQGLAQNLLKMKGTKLPTLLKGLKPQDLLKLKGLKGVDLLKKLSGLGTMKTRRDTPAVDEETTDDFWAFVASLYDGSLTGDEAGAVLEWIAGLDDTAAEN